MHNMWGYSQQENFGGMLRDLVLCTLIKISLWYFPVCAPVECCQLFYTFQQLNPRLYLACCYCYGCYSHHAQLVTLKPEGSTIRPEEIPAEPWVFKGPFAQQRYEGEMQKYFCVLASCLHRFSFLADVKYKLQKHHFNVAV